MGIDAGCLAELQSWLLDLLREASGSSAVLLLLQVLLYLLLFCPFLVFLSLKACNTRYHFMLSRCRLSERAAELAAGPAAQGFRRQCSAAASAAAAPLGVALD